MEHLCIHNFSCKLKTFAIFYSKQIFQASITELYRSGADWLCARSEEGIKIGLSNGVKIFILYISFLAFNILAIPVFRPPGLSFGFQ